MFALSKSARNRRRKHKLVGASLLLVILLSGTFAFSQMYLQAFNPDLVNVSPGGRIHDVFQVRGETDNHGERNKNVFAVNFGNVPIGVRVQFREFLELHEVPIDNIDGTTPVRMDINDIRTWSITQFDENMNRRPGTTAALIGQNGISWQLGHIIDESPKVFMPTFNHIERELTNAERNASVVPAYSLFNNPLAYAFSDANGRAVDAIAGITPVDARTLGDIELENIYDIEYHGNQTGYHRHDGSRNFWNVGQPRTANRYYIGRIANNSVLASEEVTHRARLTLPPTNGGVMSMTAWITANEPPGNFWIFDDTDVENGWFYWNGLIPPADDLGGIATSLLLATTNLPIHQNLEYIIRINSDFFLDTHLPANISTAARRIFERSTAN